MHLHLSDDGVDGTDDDSESKKKLGGWMELQVETRNPLGYISVFQLGGRWLFLKPLVAFPETTRVVLYFVLVLLGLSINGIRRFISHRFGTKKKYIYLLNTERHSGSTYFSKILQQFHTDARRSRQKQRSLIKFTSFGNGYDDTVTDVFFFFKLKMTRSFINILTKL